MSELVRPLREGAILVWRHLAEVVAVNLLWLAFSWTLLGCGPATLAAYHWLARRTRDGAQLSWRDFFPLVFRYLLPGLAWLAGVLILLGLAYSNFLFWPRVLPPFFVLAIQLFWLYLLLLAFAVQPYLLEWLTLERGQWSLRLALSRFFAESLTAHLRALVPLVLLGVGLRFRTLVPVVLVGVILVFMSVCVRPMYVPPEPVEEPSPGGLGSPHNGGA